MNGEPCMGRDTIGELVIDWQCGAERMGRARRRRCAMVTIGRLSRHLLMVGLLLLLTVGCASTPSRWGAAHVTFDGIITLGDRGTANPHVTCEGLARPEVVIPLDRTLAAYSGDWYPNADETEPQARMRLELTYADPPARVELSLGEAVYRSNDATVMAGRADWSGHASFSDLQLVRG